MFVSFLVAVEVDRFISLSLPVEISVRAGEKSIHRTFGEGPTGSVGQSSYGAAPNSPRSWAMMRVATASSAKPIASTPRWAA